MKLTKKQEAGSREIRRLRDAVERSRIELKQKNRGLAVESALERVRKVAMAMKKAEDMLEICKTISFQLQKLGIKEIRNIQAAIIDERKASYLNYEYFRLHKKTIITDVSYKEHKDIYAFVKKMLKDPEGFFTKTFKGVQIKDWMKFQARSGQFVDPHLRKVQSLHYYFYSIGPGALGISTYAPLNKEEISLFKRFRNVFQLAYRRFIDIELAIAQAREAQIEAALERIRSHAMAMRDSGDLSVAAGMVFSELKKLGIHPFRSGVGLLMKEPRKTLLYAAMEGPDRDALVLVGQLDMTAHKCFALQYESCVKQENYFPVLKSREFRSYYAALAGQISIPSLAESQLRKTHYGYYFPFKEGYFYTWTETPYTTTEISLLERFKSIISLTFRRYLDLQKAEAQAREAKIEAALEKVRGKAMAMHKTEDFNPAVETVFIELKKLDLGMQRCGIAILSKERKTANVWITAMSEKGEVMQVSGDESLDTHPLLQGAFEAWVNHEDFSYVLEGNELRTYYDADKGILLPGSPVHLEEVPQYFHFATFDAGGLFAFRESEFSAEAKKVLKRFIGVFGLTYKRFLDLQKAEEQAREARIEAALERVRSRAMSMHKTDELLDAAELIHKELAALGINSMNVSYAFVDKGEKTGSYYSVNPVDGKIAPSPFIFPHTETVVMRSILASWKKQEPFNVIELNEKVTLKHQTYIGEHIQKQLAKFNIPFSVKAFLEVSPKKAVLSTFNFKNGYLFNIGGERLSNAQEELMLRFTKVFEQTYTRFLDLQKAEAQAREAQIELGLERVRARAMAMQNSNELKELIGTVFTELTKLDLVLTRCLIMIFDPKTNGSTWWMANSEAPSDPIGLYIKYHEHPPYLEYIKAWQERNLKWQYILEGPVKKDWDDFLFVETELSHLPDFVIEGMKAPDRVYLNSSFNSFGNLTLASLDPLSNEHFDILLRFAKVFDLTYTRFNDLKQAEAQAREAKIEAALEKVRSRTMAMHKSDELRDASLVLYQQMEALGEPADQLTIGIVDEPKQVIEVFVTLRGNVLQKAFEHSVEEPYVMAKVYRAWKSKEKTLVLELKGDELYAYNKFRNRLTGTQLFPTTGSPDTRRIIYLAFFSKGVLAIGTNDPRPPNSLQLLERFASVFDLTYTRFLDLQKAEAQARESQIEAALERVRSKAMAMHKSEDLSDAVATVFEELDKLNLGMIRCGIGILNKEKRTGDVWTTAKSGEGRIVQASGDESMDIHPLLQGAFEAWIKRKDFSYVLEGEDFNRYYKALTKTNFHLPDSISFDTDRTDQRQFYYVTPFESGTIFAFCETPFSDEAKSVMKRFAGVFNLTYRRFQDLQKAEAQAREAQIEVAVERVRAKALAMHRSEDLHSAVVALKNELHNLNLPGLMAATIYLEQDNGSIRILDLSSAEEENSDKMSLDKIFRLEETHPDLWIRRIWNGREKYFVVEADEADFRRVIDWLYTIDATQARTAEKIMKENAIRHAWLPTVKLQKGRMNIDLLEPPTAEVESILLKMGAGFDLAYKRFMDLQKAEAQAREAQIELGLERVRARAMAMQKSDELKELIGTVSKELGKLDIVLDRSFIITYDTQSMGSTWWMANPETPSEQIGLFVKYHEHPPYLAHINAWKERKIKWEYILEGDVKKTWDQFLFSETELSQLPDFVIDNMRSNEKVYLSSSFNNFGYLSLATLEPLSGEQFDILLRFAKVFDLTYTRFNDLQKAEAQAREAQIETSLERVRSRTMGMQKSEELKEVIQVVYEQFVHLNIHIEHTGFIMDYKNRDDMNIWLADQRLDPFQVTIPYFDCAHWNSFKEAKEKGMNLFTNRLGFEEKNRFYQDLFKLIPGIPEETKEYYFSCPGLAISTVLLENVGLYIENFSGIPYTDEENNTLLRFGNVFQQTYTRFLDLQKAEAQTREAQIEAALEKVRTRVMAMNSSNDLNQTSLVFGEQLRKLGIDWQFSYFWLIEEDQEENTFWITWPDNKNSTTTYSLAEADESFGECIVAWKNQEKIHATHVLPEGVKAWLDTFERITEDAGGMALEVMQKDNFQDGVYYYDAMIRFGSFGILMNREINDEEKLIQVRFATEFERAYTRFLDLQKAEALAHQAELDLIKLKEEKKRTEEALAELKTTQVQLIQSEKMASLGELTAGIAHEIQNPLNFVNNFSDVSNELIEEMKSELEKGNREDAIALANDVKQNLQKILHHGKRADGIVKSMLQHSRSSSGKKELTDINALADEYLRLSYHGLRAKDKSFNAKFETHLDPSIEKITVMPQDMGRVILNLINNAFYAVSEKKKQVADGYEPTVTVSTKKLNGKIEVRVSDNGMGIPQAVLDKIFQPFFTTKPTGQGTGLGLSLSYDIITKGHGGELKVDTKEGEGSEFVIQLPLSKMSAS